MKLRHFAAVALAGVLALGLGACGGQGSSTQASPEQTQPKTMEVDEAQKAIKVRDSPDKYTMYVKNYVGMNLGNVGNDYTSSNHIYESYGPFYMNFDVQSDDGSYIDVDSMSVRKGYYVASQDPSPDTEIKVSYKTNSKGEEVKESVSVDTVVLHVAKVPGYKPTTS